MPLANPTRTHESGTLGSMPANGARPDGSTYLATDQNGGTTYRMVAGSWTQEAAAVTAGSGSMIAGPVQLSSSFSISGVGTTLTDVTGMTIAVPASSRPVLLRFKGEMQANTGTAANGSILTALVVLTDAANNNYAEAAETFVQTGTSSIVHMRTVVVEYVIPAPVSATTFKLRVKTVATVPTNWTSCALLPGNGQVTPAYDNLYALQV